MVQDGGVYGHIQGRMGWYRCDFNNNRIFKTKDYSKPSMSIVLPSRIWRRQCFRTMRVQMVSGWRLAWRIDMVSLLLEKTHSTATAEPKKYKQKNRNKMKCYKPGMQRMLHARWYKLGQSSHWPLHHLSGLHFLHLILKYSSNLSIESGMIKS
jgi:hypothetical protein